MKKVSFIRRVLMIGFFVSSIAFFPIQNLAFSSGSSVVKAAEVQETDGNTVKLNVKSKSLVRTDSYAIKVYRTTEKQKITFKTSDAEIVTVEKNTDNNKEAIITGISAGTATITVYVKEGFKTVKTLKCEITVTPPALLVTLTEKEITLYVGDTISLKKELKPSNTAEVPIYSDYNPKLISVSTQGTVFAKAPGKTTITATIANGGTDSCTITVVEPEIPDTLLGVPNSSNNISAK